MQPADTVLGVESMYDHVNVLVYGEEEPSGFVDGGFGGVDARFVCVYVSVWG